MTNITITIDRNAAIRALQDVTKTQVGVDTNSIMDNVLIAADGERGEVTFTASALDVQISHTTELCSEESASCTVHAKDFLKILKVSREDFVKLEVDQDPEAEHVNAILGATVWKLEAKNPADFPTFPAWRGEQIGCRIFAPVLSAALENTYKSMANDDTRYYLNGAVFFKNENGQLQILATDGHTLRSQDTNVNIPDFNQVIVPRKVLTILRALLKSTRVGIEVTISSNRIDFEYDGRTLTSEIVDGNYPQWQRVVPTFNSGSNFQVDQEAMLAAVKNISVLKAKGTPKIVMTKPNNNELAISFEHVRGVAETSIGADFSVGDTYFASGVGFNAKYFADVIADCGDGEISFSQDTHTDPMLVAGSREGWFAVVMPMRV